VGGALLVEVDFGVEGVGGNVVISFLGIIWVKSR